MTLGLCLQSVVDLILECVRLDPRQRPTADQVLWRLQSGSS